ncbi:MAG: DUF2007 domain-containing protein [Chloroflexi bacterium]|nr:DUF2007 domain-containing protein [Chloroflexota bacterium]MCI0578363.1 DUF2007 domain-containing protein [Chloroflexota bacterium]MCI0646234.1 DUF2007 domain-containing protein [Chloroflexota bacterium]MCI0732146.1 DUF2007 domain-containing protein [Chloroflexota bacterium]
MSTLFSQTWPAGQDGDESESETSSVAGTTTPGGKQEVRWQVVAETPGLAGANIIAGRLQAEGIPARAWQESAGQAFGLIVGMLGAGYVEVPEAYAEQAEALLAETLDDAAFDEEE